MFNAKFPIMKNGPDVLSRIKSCNYFTSLNKYQFDTEPTQSPSQPDELHNISIFQSTPFALFTASFLQ